MASYCGLSFEIQVTGDCSNTSSGSFSIAINGNAPDYTIQFISPTTDVYYLGNNVTATTFTSLSAGTYVFEVIDSCLTAGTPTIASLTVSSGTTVTCTDISNTSNDLNNGSITAQTYNLYGVSSFYLYDYDNGYLTSGDSFFNYFIFDSLSAATYYVIANDGGGCTGQSETVIIKSSTTFDYGFYVINTSTCTKNNGKIFVTGLTGNDPYNYLWSNGQTGSSISGLTEGSYKVTVTDKEGTQVTKGTTINSASRLSLVSNLITSPSCYGDDGSFRFTISGGTPPYNYLLSNGEERFSFLNSVLINQIPAGYYTMQVIDSGLCTLTENFSVLAPKGFNVVSLNKKNTYCGTNQGYIEVRLVGGSPNYNYSLVSENGDVKNFSTNSQSQIFSNLYAGTYTLNISDFGPCTYSEIVEIESENVFTINVETYDITCGNEFGSVNVEIIGEGMTPYTYKLTSRPNVRKSEKTLTYDNLTEGSYLLSVIDNSGCLVNQNIVINSPQGVNFSLFTQKTKGGVDGKIDLYITKGIPPFTIQWSDNAGSNSGITLNNLSAGTYSVTVTDGNGCTQYRSTNLDGQNLISAYRTYNVCDSNITDTGVVNKKGLQQMLSEGFYDLTSGDNNCVMNQAIFTAIVYLSGVTSSSVFYTSNSLDDFPFDNDFYEVVEQILLSTPGIDNVIFNSSTNQVRINTGCGNQTVSLIDSEIQISVNIEYDITCESCGGSSLLGSFPYVVTDGLVYGYDPENKIYITLPESDKYTTIIGIARDNTDTKVWILNDGGLEIFEYDVVSLVPYIVNYNRTITLSSQVSGDLIWLDNTTLLSSNDSSNYLSSIDILSGNISNGIFLSSIPSTVLNNSMLFNSSNNIIVITNDVDGFQYLRQYNKSGVLQVEVSLPATFGYTMYEYNSVFYLVDLGNYQVYSILPTSPYTLTAEYILDTPIATNIFIMSQINTYVTTNFT
jgi:hypothetical protein